MRPSARCTHSPKGSCWSSAWMPVFHRDSRYSTTRPTPLTSHALDTVRRLAARRSGPPSVPSSSDSLSDCGTPISPPSPGICIPSGTGSGRRSRLSVCSPTLQRRLADHRPGAGHRRHRPSPLEGVGWCTDDEDKMVQHLSGTLTDARALLWPRDPTPWPLSKISTLFLRCVPPSADRRTGVAASPRCGRPAPRPRRQRLEALDAVRRAVLGDLMRRGWRFRIGRRRGATGRGTPHLPRSSRPPRRLLRQGGDGVAALRRRYRRL